MFISEEHSSVHIAYAMQKAHLHELFFCCDFPLLIDVNESIYNECAECVLAHLYIRERFTRSHPSKGENRTRNSSCERLLITISVPNYCYQK